MAKRYKCEYCESKPDTTHGKEFLCTRHYNILYAVKNPSKVKIDVPKTNEEKKLHEHYMIILSKFDFEKSRNIKKLVKQFLIDVQKIKSSNPIYFQK